MAILKVRPQDVKVCPQDELSAMSSNTSQENVSISFPELDIGQLIYFAINLPEYFFM